MITQQFSITCNAPSARIDPDLPAVSYCATETIAAPSSFHAGREFQRRGWYLADDAKTYCEIHAESARRLDQTAREKARRERA